MEDKNAKYQMLTTIRGLADHATEMYNVLGDVALENICNAFDVAEEIAVFWELSIAEEYFQKRVPVDADKLCIVNVVRANDKDDENAIPLYRFAWTKENADNETLQDELLATYKNAGFGDVTLLIQPW